MILYLVAENEQTLYQLVVWTLKASSDWPCSFLRPVNTLAVAALFCNLYSLSIDLVLGARLSNNDNSLRLILREPWLFGHRARSTRLILRESSFFVDSMDNLSTSIVHLRVLVGVPKFSEFQNSNLSFSL